MTGTFPEALTWTQSAEKIWTDWQILLPIGAAAREHGPHLPPDTTATVFLTSNWLGPDTKSSYSSSAQPRASSISVRLPS